MGLTRGSVRNGALPKEGRRGGGRSAGRAQTGTERVGHSSLGVPGGLEGFPFLEERETSLRQQLPISPGGTSQVCMDYTPLAEEDGFGSLTYQK